MAIEIKQTYTLKNRIYAQGMFIVDPGTEVTVIAIDEGDEWEPETRYKVRAHKARRWDGKIGTYSKEVDYSDNVTWMVTADELTDGSEEISEVVEPAAVKEVAQAAPIAQRAADTSVQYYNDVHYYEIKYGSRFNRFSDNRHMEGSMFLIEMEQRQEETRLKELFKAQRMEPAKIKPETFMIINSDNKQGIVITLLCPGLDKRHTFSCKYNGGNPEILRAQTIAKAESAKVDANRNPYKFWLD